MSGLASQSGMGRSSARRESRPARPIRRLASRLTGAGLAMVLSVTAGLWWLRRPPATDEEARSRLLRLKPSPSELNLVVVTLDTLRADRLGCYGFTGIEPPAPHGLAR